MTFMSQGRLKMKPIFLLLQKLRLAKNTPETLRQHYISDSINTFLSLETDPKNIDFVNGVKNLDLFSQVRFLERFVSDEVEWTIKEIVEDGSIVMFELNEQTYEFSGFRTGFPLFRKIGTTELISLDLSPTVKRIF